MYKTKAYSAASATSPLASATIPRREPTERDVQIEILFCGICHSDLHAGPQRMERVHATSTRSSPATRSSAGSPGSARPSRSTSPATSPQSAAWSTRTEPAPTCQAGLENFCPNLTLTFNSPDKHKTAPVTYGGYSDSIVVDERFVLRVPANLDSRRDRAAALRRHHDLLAPAPLGRHQGQEGRRGRPRRAGPHGREVRPRVRGPCRRLHHFARQEGGRAPPRRRRGRRLPQRRRDARSTPAASTSSSIASLPNTTSTPTSTCSRRDGNLTLVGAPAKPLGVSAFGLIMGRRSLSGSNIGGIAETQEMLDFCGQHNITADVEVIPIQKVNEAYERLLKSDVKYRFSIDMASLKSA